LRRVPRLTFDALYGEYADPIYRFCYRLSGSAADAEDLAQEVFVLAYQGLAGFEGRSCPSTWLYRIAIRRWQRMRKQPGPTTVHLDEDLDASPSHDPADIVLERLSLGEALGTLPDVLREAFLLVKAEGLSYREAAAILDAPQGTIQWRVHEAVVRLRRQLGNEEGNPGPVRACGHKELIHEV
jgi:RNA polymerase sigma-70 factor, ECF subfamily